MTRPVTSQFVAPSTVDRPFALAPWACVIDLPLPPSVNRFMAKLGNRSPVVKVWVRDADAHFISQMKNLRNIIGPYEIEITWSAMRRGISDIGNREKALSDWLQRVGLVENDRMCERMTLLWGVAPEGCRVRLRAWGCACSI
jgi:hypothetical protein